MKRATGCIPGSHPRRILEQFGRVSPVLRVHGNRKRKRRAGKRVVRIVASGTASCGVWRSIKWHHQTPQSSEHQKHLRRERDLGIREKTSVPQLMEFWSNFASKEGWI
jgi:hypothetical protein